jgi:hypothetical protein
MTSKQNARKDFTARHAARSSCALSGFERLVFRGTLLPLMPDGESFHLLNRAGVRLLDFKASRTTPSRRADA